MDRKHLQRMNARTPAAYRKIAVAVPVEAQNEFEEFGKLLLGGALFCFAVGAIARAL